VFKTNCAYADADRATRGAARETAQEKTIEWQDIGKRNKSDQGEFIGEPIVEKLPISILSILSMML